jgi:hypothetical protein
MSTADVKKYGTRTSEIALAREDAEFTHEIFQSLQIAFKKTSESSKVSLRSILGSPESVVQHLLKTLPKTSKWSDVLGPMYTGSSLAAAMGVSRQTISERAKKKNLVSLQTVDSHVLYPSFQFDTHLQPIQGLSDIWRVLTGSGTDEWMCASWLLAPLRGLNGSNTVAFLKFNGKLEIALVEAESAVRRWAS